MSVVFALKGGLVIGWAFGLAFGVPFAIRAGSPYAWSAFLTFVQLKREGQGPHEMLHFLEDARERGILRTAGPVYQFRHARLQDLLAGARDASRPRAAQERP